MITGCAGFIGSHATDCFIQNGNKVIGVDLLTYAGNMQNLKQVDGNLDFKFIKDDICNTERIEELCTANNVEWIINFAAETHVDNSINSDNQFIHSNILGVKSLLDVCRRTGSKLFHISTDEVYGSTIDGPFSENDKLSPQNPYSATKAAAEHLIRSYQNTHGIEYLMARPSNNFGPRQHEEKFLPTIVRSLDNDAKIPVYGDGKNVRDWLYVKDNVQIIYQIWKNSEINQIYNISLSNERTNLDIVGRVLNIMEKSFEDSVSFVADRPGHDFRYSIDNEKILKLGINIDSNFEENLLYTVDALRRANQ